MRRVLFSVLLCASTLLCRGQVAASGLTFADLASFVTLGADATSRVLLKDDWTMTQSDVTEDKFLHRLFRTGAEMVSINWNDLVPEHLTMVSYMDGTDKSKSALFYLDALEWLRRNDYRTDKVYDEPVKGKEGLEGCRKKITRYKKRSADPLSYDTVTVIVFTRPDATILWYQYDLFSI